MSTGKDPVSAWLPRPDPPDERRATCPGGVQDGDGGAVGDAGDHLRATPREEAHRQGNQDSRGVQGTLNLDGFIAREWIPHAYQIRGVGWLLNIAAGLFLPPGLGKTSISLAAILELKKMQFNHRTLILAPLMVCRTTWQTEPLKWKQFQGLRIGFAHGPDKRLILKDPHYDIVIMNYDGIEWAAPMLAQGHQFGVLLCDELPRLKNTNSKRFKLIKPLLPSFHFRWGLTGTPVANGLMDLFGQLYVLDGGVRLGKFITHFRLKYFHQIPWDQYRYYITPERAEQLVAKIKDICMYVSDEEWLELPDFLPIVLEVDFAEGHRKLYDTLEKEFVLRVTETAVITVANGGVMTSKLRQFTGGGVYLEDKSWINVSDSKMERLEELVEEMAGEPLLVAYQFDHELTRFLDKWPNALFLKGGMSMSKVTKTMETWNTGQVPILFIQPSSAALGINLQFGGSAICWYTFTYNLEEFIQLNKRLHRQGQTKAVRCYMLTMKETLDVGISKVLSDKEITQQDVFNALKVQM